MPKPTSGQASVGRIASRTVDSLLEGVQVVGPDIRYLYLNETALRHAGVAWEQLSGRTMSEVFPGIESTAMFELLQQCMHDRAPREMVNEFSYADGSAAWFELRFEPVPEGVAILSLDITAWRLVERSERSKTRAHEVMSACNRYLVRATDEALLMEDVCRAAVEQGGYLLAWIGVKDDGPERLVRPLASAGNHQSYVAGLRISWVDDERGRGPTGRAIRTGAPAVVRFVAEDQDFLPWRAQALERGFLSAIALPLRIDGDIWGTLNIYSGEPDAFDDDERALLSGMAEDLSFGISALRSRQERQRTLEVTQRLDSQLRALNAELEERVVQRTRQLEVARDAAEAANRAKNAFLSNMSHEVRTPMNAILGFSQLLLRNAALTNTQRQHVEAITRAGGRLVALIEGVLQLAGIEAGRVSVQEADFDLPALVREVGQWLRPQADAKGVQFVIDASQVSHPFVATDENKLRLVLAHLIGNAIKFTEHGRITVRVSTVDRSGKGLRLVAQVEDSGPGIAPEELQRLFRKLEQTQTGSEGKLGAGVGLAISQEYARLMGGEISADSQRGTGTVFRLEIPVRASSALRATPTLPAPAIKRLQAGASCPKILIADDEELERGLSAGLLEAIGFDTAQSQLGESMFALVRAWRPDLVLIGARVLATCLTTIHHVRAVGGDGLKIICLSGAGPEDRRAACDAGADDCVRKPVPESELLDAVRSLLEVDYEYDDDVLPPAPESGEVEGMGLEHQTDLPEELRARIHRATVAADIDALLTLIERVGEYDPALASRLRAHAARFDYVPILELVGA